MYQLYEIVDRKTCLVGALGLEVVIFLISKKFSETSKKTEKHYKKKKQHYYGTAVKTDFNFLSFYTQK